MAGFVDHIAKFEPWICFPCPSAGTTREKVVFIHTRENSKHGRISKYGKHGEQDRKRLDKVASSIPDAAMESAVVNHEGAVRRYLVVVSLLGRPFRLFGRRGRWIFGCHCEVGSFLSLSTCVAAPSPMSSSSTLGLDVRLSCDRGFGGLQFKPCH